MNQADQCVCTHKGVGLFEPFTVKLGTPKIIQFAPILWPIKNLSYRFSLDTLSVPHMAVAGGG